MIGAEGRAGRADAKRPITYCLVPADLAAELHEPLRAHLGDSGDIEVIVEHRAGERRGDSDRRGSEGRPPGERERRRIRNPAGRRAGERRAPLAAVDGPSLPPEAAAYADRIGFAERLEPASEHAEDLDTARVVTRIQAGADSDFSVLYRRYFDRIYVYLRILLDDAAEAEELTRTTFERVYEELPRYERGRPPFRAWLSAAVRREALRHLGERGAIDQRDPLADGTHLERAAVEDEELFTLHWVTDRDLLVLIERLPPDERRVLLLRYMLELPSTDVAEMLNQDGGGIRTLQKRAGDFLRERLSALR